MNDTAPNVETLFQQMLMAKAPAERMRMASSMHSTVKAIALSALREEHPGASESKLKGLLFLRFYSEDFAPQECETIFNWLCGSE